MKPCFIVFALLLLCSLFTRARAGHLESIEKLSQVPEKQQDKHQRGDVEQLLQVILTGLFHQGLQLTLDSLQRKTTREGAISIICLHVWLMSPLPANISSTKHASKIRKFAAQVHTGDVKDKPIGLYSATYNNKSSQTDIAERDWAELTID